MPGAVELAEEIFHMPVRLGSARHVDGLSDVIGNPIYATAAGLLLFSNGNQSLRLNVARAARQNLLTRVKGWLQNSF